MPHLISAMEAETATILGFWEREALDPGQAAGPGCLKITHTQKDDVYGRKITPTLGGWQPGKPRLANAFIVVGRGASSKLGDSSIQEPWAPLTELILAVITQNNPGLLCLLLDDKEKGDIFISLDMMTTAPHLLEGSHSAQHTWAGYFCWGRRGGDIASLLHDPTSLPKPTLLSTTCVLGD